MLVGLLLPPDWVRCSARAVSGAVADEPVLFPAVLRGDAQLHALMAQLVHTVSGAGAVGARPHALMTQIVQTLLSRQTWLEALLARCPGRSLRYRRQVLLRLLRARLRIECTPGEDASLARLATIANMSPTHFLRLYRGVFGQTPHKHVVESRLHAARDMLVQGARPIAEIHGLLGFENRCAFSRVFKQHFGLAPANLRDAARRGRLSAPLEAAGVAA